MVVDDRKLVGVVAESDIVIRAARPDFDIKGPIGKSDCMTRTPTTVTPESLMPEALDKFSTRRFSAIPVINKEGVPVGKLGVRVLLERFVGMFDQEFSGLTGWYDRAIETFDNAPFEDEWTVDGENVYAGIDRWGNQREGG